MKHFFLLLIFICNLISGYAQNSRLYFDRLDINKGLSQNTVNVIIQDSRGFMWFGTKDGLNRYDGRTFKIFRHNSASNLGLGNSYITNLAEDLEHNIWVGTDAGLYIFYPEQERFENISLYTENGDLIINSIQGLNCDKDGYVWITVDGNGIFCYNPKTKKTTSNYKEKGTLRSLKSDKNGVIWLSWYGGGLFYSEDKLKTIKPFLSSRKEIIFSHDVISDIYISDYNRLYLGLEENGVVEVNLITSEVKKLKLSDDPNKHIFVRDLLYYSDDELWIASESGIYIYNIKTHKYKNLQNSAYDPYSISDNAIYSLCKDREGGLWIGSFFGGINYLPQRNANFDKSYDSNPDRGLKGRRVREICKGNDGMLWVGTEDAGLYSFNPQTKEFSFFAPSKNFSNVHGLCTDGDNLWVSTFSKGVQVINTRTKQVRSYINGNKPGSLNNNYVFALCKTKVGQIYLGTMYGLQYYDKTTDRFIEIPEVTGGKMINDIKEDSDGNLWIATFTNGVYKYNLRNKTCRHYVHNRHDSKSLPYNKVLSIFEDSYKQIWLTTEGFGFCKYNPATETFVRYNSVDEMPSNVIYQIVEDNKGFFWITTNHGLVKFNPKKETVEKVYTTANGLLNNQFNYKSSYKSEDGTIYFGCIDGLISFNPDALLRNEYIPPIYITDFSFLDKKIVVGEKGSPLKKSIIFSDSVILKHNQNSISLQIASLSYQAPLMNQLLYKLEGFDENWRRYSPDASTITYSKISYGKYIFKIKGSNNDGVWNLKEKHLYIEIVPPFYLSRTAYFFYILLFISLIVAGIMSQIKRNERKQRRYIQVFEREKERELYDSKINFFTNVAHEIRTPLTLIKGPLENILKKKKIETDVAEDLYIMKQNTDRLLDLTNQLLDFRKTEKEGFRLSFSKYNVSLLVEETFHRFSSLAKQKNIEFVLNMENKDLYACIDKEAFIKILSNLLNNALKYSDSYIHVILDVDSATQDKTFGIKVINDGDVVPVEMRENIFEPFFRYTRKDESNTPGTGIGLALSRSLTELHHGSLIMKEEDGFNVFILTLPIYQDAEKTVSSNMPNDNNDNKTDYNSDTNDKTHTILVVEDNKEMRNFIKRQISCRYSVLMARNGIDALNVLNKHYVNLIVSDIMMPVMDGFELCKKVKEDVNFSHIPIIMLTAKVNIQSKIEGMDIGADAYIEKPFSSEYLLAVIANLINGREKLCEIFSKYPLVIANTVAVSKTDTDFLVKLQEVIHANFSNPDFKIEDIAETMNMSRTHFYRKIKGVLDMTPNDYLRLERLKAAAHLLKDKKFHINEICYMVGFNSPSYFSKCFQQQFGVLPKDFINDN